MKHYILKPCAAFLVGLIAAEAFAISHGDSYYIKETDIPAENMPYPSPNYTLGGIVATTGTTNSFGVL